MSEILSELFTLPVQIVLAATVFILILLWLLSIVWVNHDARQRGTSAVLWTIVAIIPVAGLVAYCLLRPSMTVLDEEEQNMELDLLQRQLGDYGNCPHCGYPVDRDFVVCPKCRKRLRNVCHRCGRVLQGDWSICPYCTAAVEHGGQRRGRGQSEQRQQQAQDASRDPFDPS